MTKEMTKGGDEGDKGDIPDLCKKQSVRMTKGMNDKGKDDKGSMTRVTKGTYLIV